MDRKNLKHAVYTILLLVAGTAAQALAQTPRRTGPAPAEEIEKARVVVAYG